jgi:glycosyltransferase involved in cell wall biosynthesis
VRINACATGRHFAAQELYQLSSADSLNIAIIDDAGFGRGISGLFGKELYSGLLADINENLLGNVSARINLGDNDPKRMSGSWGGTGVPLLRAFRDAGTVREMRSLMRRANTDIAHANVVNARYPRSVIKAVRDAKVPLVTTVHSYNSICPTGWATKLPELEPCGDLGAQIHCPVCLWNEARLKRAPSIRRLLDGFNQYDALRFLLRESDSVVVPSRALASRIEAGIGSLRLDVAYNPLPAELFRSEPYPGEERTVAFAGRLTFEKGAHLLPRLADMMKGTSLHVMGKGPLADFIQMHARSRPNLIFHGFVSQEEKLDIFRRATAILVPSLWFEAFGYSAAEALALGKPVVGFDVGGIGELVSRSGGGRVVKPFGIGDLADAVEAIAGDTKASRELGMKGWDFARNELSEDAFASKLQRIYSKTLSRHH